MDKMGRERSQKKGTRARERRRQIEIPGRHTVGIAAWSESKESLDEI